MEECKVYILDEKLPIDNSKWYIVWMKDDRPLCAGSPITVSLKLLLLFAKYKEITHWMMLPYLKAN